MAISTNNVKQIDTVLNRGVILGSFSCMILFGFRQQNLYMPNVLLCIIEAVI